MASAFSFTMKLANMELFSRTWLVGWFRYLSSAVSVVVNTTARGKKTSRVLGTIFHIILETCTYSVHPTYMHIHVHPKCLENSLYLPTVLCLKAFSFSFWCSKVYLLSIDVRE